MDGAQETPLIDLLRNVKPTAHGSYMESKFCSHHVPYGRLMHSAADEIESLRQQLAAAQDELEAERNRRFEGNRISSKEYNDSQNQVTLLRDVVKKSRLLLKLGKSKTSILSIDVVKLCEKELVATEPKELPK